MRLTLRTLLAYLDERLEPADAADIGHRIEESAVAMQVVNRIRDVTRRLRLGAPRLSGKQLGLDPNLVAEYLDNTLPAERIPEFEKVCLGAGSEADAHLAEVASCHQVLALVLSSPATVDPACRQRMYRLGAAELAGAASPQPAAAAAVAEPRTLEVPEYLRPVASRWPWVAVPIAALILGLLAFAVSKSLRPRGTGSLAQAPAAEQAPPVAPGDPPPRPAVAPEAQGDSEGPTEEIVEPVEIAGTGVLPPEGAHDEAGQPADHAEALSEAPQEPADVQTPEPAAANPPPTEISGSPDGAAAADVRPAPAVILPPALSDMPAPVNQASPDAAIGRMVSDESELVALWSERERAWIRVPSKQPLRAGDQLLSFPTFRPKFTLSSGVTIELNGAARVELLTNNGAGVPGLRVDFGRVTAMTAGKAGVELRLITAHGEGVATFVTADSAMGFEVRPTHIEGLDPAAEPDHVVAWLYVSQGTIGWQSGGDQAELDAPHVDQLDGDRLLALDEAMPPWVLGQDRTTSLDNRARSIFASQVAIERPVDLGFKELAVDRRIEARSLAMRCLALQNEFEGLLAALGQLEMRSGWNNYIESLRFAMAAQPEAAQRVREALQRQRPGDAQRLYRLLWGFSREQLAKGEAQQLVNDLENESLDVRVLANWNVSRITGKSFYQPEQTAKRRQSAVQRLRRMVDEGQFIPSGDLPGEVPVGAGGADDVSP